MRAGIYARLSLLREGQEGLAVGRQIDDCTAKAADLDWTVEDVYVDEDRSASKDVVREDYDRMLADLESGRLNAVVVHDLDRLTRKPAELETFIDLCDRRGVALANVSGDVDLTTSSGRMLARIKGAVARQEAERTGERVSRQKLQRASNGRGPGARFRTFGYSRSFEPVKSEAEIVREVFRRAASGEALQAITRDLNDRGIPTTSGGPWRRSTLAGILARPGYAGIAVHKGERVGSTAYPALVEPGLFEAAQRTSTGPGFNGRVYLLSGIAVCGLCHSPMYGNRASAGRYLCRPHRPGACGRVTIRARWLDAAVGWHVAARIAEEAERPVESVRDFAAEVAEADARIAALRAAHAAGDLELQDLLPMLKAERERRAGLVREESAAVEATSLDRAAETFEDYRSGSVSARRARVRRYFQAVEVLPTTSAGRRRFDPSRIRLLWTDGRVTGWDLDVSPGAFEALLDWYAPADVTR